MNTSVSNTASGGGGVDGTVVETLRKSDKFVIIDARRMEGTLGRTKAI